jgi:hypothetical protein
MDNKKNALGILLIPSPSILSLPWSPDLFHGCIVPLPRIVDQDIDPAITLSNCETICFI